MCIRLCLGLALTGLLSLCCAQTPKPPQEQALALYQQAKAALSALPEPARPAVLLSIAEAEQKYHPNPARADLQTAFADAVALPAGAWQRHVKRYVELSAITDLATQPGGFALAQQLARPADIRRAWVYNELIAASATRAWMVAHPTGVPQTNLLSTDSIGSLGFVPPALPPHAARLAPPGDVVAMARASVSADGSFPYRGALAALHFYQLSAAQRDALLRAGYTAAGHETDARALPQAVALLRAGHAWAPELDAQMETAAEGLLPHLQAAVRAAEAVRGDRRARQMAAESAVSLELSGSRVLQLIEHVDAAGSASLRVRYADFPPHMSARTTVSFHPAPGASDPAVALSQAEAMPQRTPRDQQMRFLALLRLALQRETRNAGVARATTDALQMMTPRLLESALPLVAQLALVMKQDRSQLQQAEALIHRCLDALESEAVRREHAFDAAPARFRAGLAILFETSNGPSRVFRIAAQIDPALAAERAAQTQATYFRPLFLEQAAAGMEGQTQWRE